MKFKLPSFLKPKLIDNLMPMEQFLEVIEHTALDDPMPLGIVSRDTLLHILRSNFAFYDQAEQRWWLTPQGAAVLRPRSRELDGSGTLPPHERTDD